MSEERLEQLPATPHSAFCIPHSALVTRWATYLADHVLPGTLYVLAAMANLSVVAEIAAGAGPGVGLDPAARAWLLVNRACVTIFVALIAVLFMIRRRRVGPRAGLVPAVVALLGMNAHVVGFLAPVTETALSFTIPGAVLGLAGTILMIVALACLGRSFGIMPEARRLVTVGPYRWVRHPLYLAEITAAVGGLLTSISVPTVSLFVIFVALQYARALYEERALTHVFPEYVDYAQHTWRILPGIH